MSEKKIEKRLNCEIKKLKGLSLKLNSQSANGIPDRLALLPDGKLYFIELKSRGKKLDPLQEYWRKKLEGLGFEAKKIDSLEILEEFISEVVGGDQ